MMFELFLSGFVKGVAIKEETIFLNTKMVAFSLLATFPIMFCLNLLANSVVGIQGGAEEEEEEVVVEQIREVVDEDGNEMQCAVCLNQVCKGEKVKILGKCNHGFHVSCIDSWLRTNPSCPLCRSDVSVRCVTKKCRWKIVVSFCKSFFEGFCKSFLGLSTDSVGDGHYFY